ncbi:MAG: response regulator transcription factor [Chthoniobacteraceae bacterium]
MKKLRILIADDHDLVRAGTRTLIEGEPDWVVCAEASNGREAVTLAAKHKPDVAILDMTMPEMNGLDAAREIKRLLPATEIVLYTSHENEQLILDVFEAGARSYVLKNDASSQLAAAIRAAAAHKPYFTSKVSEVVFARFLQGGARGGEADPEKGRLSSREREVVQMLCEGRSNKEVAAALGISVRTAETHRAGIMAKLGFESFSDLVRYAIRNGIIAA